MARSGGFSLVELAVAVAVALLLATIAMPSYLHSIERARRADAVAALTRVQIAQEQYRANNGSYSARLSALRGAGTARSEGGLYDIALLSASSEAYVAAATARSDGPQARDTECAHMTVTLSGSLTELGPSRRCWEP